MPGITPKDADDIRFGLDNDIDFIAASFVRKAQDVLDIREILEEKDMTHVQIFPKIESQEGIDNIDEIIKVSDGVMIARGDMGVEIPAELVPMVQKRIIKKCNAAGIPVITATQTHVQHVRKLLTLLTLYLMAQMQQCYLVNLQMGTTQLKLFQQWHVSTKKLKMHYQN